MLALALFLLAPQEAPETPETPKEVDPFAELFLPAFEHREKPAAEWLVQFEKSEGRDVGALWCVYYGNDRSEEIVQALLRIFEDLDGKRARHDVDVILDQWGIEHECDVFEKDWEGSDLVPEWVLDPDDDRSYNNPWDRTSNRRAKYYYVPPYGAFPLPGDEYESSDEDVFEFIEARDRVRQARVALTLIRRGIHLPEAVEALGRRLYDDMKGMWIMSGWSDRDGRVPSVRTGGDLHGETRRYAKRADITLIVWTWATRYLGNEIFTVLAELEADPDVDEDLTRFLRDAVGFWRVDEAARIAERLRVEDLDHRDLWALVEAAGIRIERMGHGRLHREEPPWKVNPRAAAVLVRKLEDLGRRDELTPPMRDGMIEAAGAVGFALPEYRTRLRPLLARDLESAERGSSALYWLTHWGDTAADVRSSFVAAMNDFDAETDLPLRPCLAQHDEVTAAALHDVVERGELHSRSAFQTFEFGGLLDGGHGGLVELLIEKSQPTKSGEWYGFFAEDDRDGLADEGEAVDFGVLAYRITNRIRKLRALDRPHAKECAAFVAALKEPDSGGALAVARKLRLQHDGLIDHALWLAVFPFAEHNYSDPMPYLEVVTLNPRRQAILCHFGRPDPPASSLTLGDWPYRLLARQGPALIEKIPDLRELAVEQDGLEGDVDAFEAILDISPVLSGWDEDYLIAALDRARAHVRSRCLSLIHQRELDTPRLREALANSARNDVSRERRTFAQEILDSYED